MNVTRRNFDVCLKDIRNSIYSDSCQFIAIDTEFTGLSPSDSDKEWYLDTLEDRYRKVKAAGESFLITQFGIATMHALPKLEEDSGQHEYEIRVWNCYVFPRPNEYSDSRFLCQASCLQFLASHGFDFNKCFRDGISFSKLSKVSSMKKKLEKKIKNLTEKSINNSYLFLDDKGKQFQEDVRSKVKNWIHSQTLSTNDEKEMKKLLIRTNNSYQRRIVYAIVEEFDAASLCIDLVADGMEIVQATSEEIKSHLNKKTETMTAKFEEAIGFSRVLECISESKKPVIAHNCLLDFIYTYHQFYAPLPNQLSDWKKSLTTLLPNIYDTKLLITRSALYKQMESTGLSDMFMFMCDRLSISPSNAIFGHDSMMPYRGLMRMQDNKDPNNYELLSNCHEAGFDALMTAVCFLGIISHDMETGQLLVNYFDQQPVKKKKSRKGRKKHTDVQKSTKQIPAEPIHKRIERLHPWKNKIYLMNSDGKHLDLTEQTQTIDRSRVYHVHSFKRKVSELCFDTLFEPCKVQVRRVLPEGSQTAFVILSDTVRNGCLPIQTFVSKETIDPLMNPEKVSSKKDTAELIVQTFAEYTISKLKPQDAPLPKSKEKANPNASKPQKETVQRSCDKLAIPNHRRTLWDRCAIS